MAVIKRGRQGMLLAFAAVCLRALSRCTALFRCVVGAGRRGFYDKASSRPLIS